MTSTANRKRSPGSGGKPALSLETPLTYLKGAGPQAASSLRSLDLHTVGDLLFHLPLRYEDRRSALSLSQLREGMEVQARGKVEISDVRFGPRRVLLVALEHEGHGLLLRFFHFNETQRAKFVSGRWVQAYGQVRSGRNGLEMVHPEYQVADDPSEFSVEQNLTPIYPLTAGMTQGRLRKLIFQSLDVAKKDKTVGVPLPGLGEPDSLSALRLIHQPSNESDLQSLIATGHPAQHRLIREELLAHQLCMRQIRQRTQVRPATAIESLEQSVKDFASGLPFDLTGAQHRVLKEIGTDLERIRPMLRLVQGDVGSGKTVVAACAMLAAARSGAQSALMAPTELLAEQHFASLQAWFEPKGISVTLLTGKLRKKERERRLAAVASGEAAMIVGTHAIFQGDVSFDRLCLVIIDEQHRFGVQQRMQLRDKGPDGQAPHQLVMSATPIPRTLAQTVYADLDISIIDELPPGRTPIQTVAVSMDRRPEVVQRLRDACAEGRQVYWVCTLIEENDEIEAQAAAVTAEKLRELLPDCSVGLVHGKLKADQKESEMRAFKDGHTQLLVATTVIEVGVDVPNASIMVIENAERLGLSQLHQLRGRVGRGSAASQCVLIYQPPLSRSGRARLDVMRATTDGFRIAKADLELRGPGELLGRRQTGLVGLKIADPVRDSEAIPALQKLADEYLERFPDLAKTLVQRWVGDVDSYARI